MLLLGFSAGLPFLLVFSTLSAWLAQAGIERATIGMLSWVGITYSIKFFWAPVIDRLPLPLLTRWLGRRRAWMLLAQCGLAAGLYGLSTQDPATQLAGMVIFAITIAFSSATQDIVVDAWRIESATAEQQGAMSAAYQLGYRIALIVAGAGCLFLAAEYDWHTAYRTMALLVGVGLVTTLLIREPVGRATTPAQLETRATDWLAARAHWPRTARQLGAWFIGAIVCPFADFFERNGIKLALLILAFVGLFRLTDITMGVMANPFYLSIGYTLKEVAAIAKGFGVVMSIIGAFIGGLAVARYGARRSLIAGGLFVIGSNLCFVLLAVQAASGIPGLALVISADNFASGFAGAAFIAYLSGLTNTAYTATQYALFSSLFTLPGKLLGGLSGYVVDAIGYAGFFLYTSALGIPALLLIITLTRLAPPKSASGDLSGPADR